jgi:hypothetical protein
MQHLADRKRGKKVNNNFSFYHPFAIVPARLTVNATNSHHPSAEIYATSSLPLPREIAVSSLYHENAF